MPPTKPALDILKQLIPPLSHEFHKGQAGRIGIIGGSEDYTGAPFFSGISAMRLGVDLCHIFCEPGAATVIKSYSPDLIVHPYLRKSEKNKPSDLTTDEIVSSVAALFPRLHVLVIGPGLSRDTLMLDCAKGVIGKAREQDMPIVIDADGLFLIQSHPEVIRNYRKAVLTPNVVEFKRLCEHILPQNTQNSKFKSEDIATRLSQALGGVTIVQKGHEDLIANDEQVFVCDADGGLKRVGGQGDILSGAIATFLAWGKAYEENVWKHDFNIRSADIPILASYAGCSLLRETARSAYARHGRAVLTSDMIGEIGAAFTRVFGDGALANKL